MTKNSPLIKAAFKDPVERTPVWVMRQAGRYLPEYRMVRKKAGGFLDMCLNPEYAAEVSIQPLTLMGVDAVIMFSDILTPLMGMGIELNFEPGPKINNPVRSESDIKRLKIPDPDKTVPYVGELLRILNREIGGEVPIIGFAGAPFTLACYLVEGGNSKMFSRVKKLLFEIPKQGHLLMDKLTEMTILYLKYQIERGAEVLQLFDTWAGLLSPDDFKEYVFPYVSRIFSSIKDLSQKKRIPLIYYINGGNHLLSLMALTGADVVGLDWRSDIGEAKKLIGSRVALQGNLDPDILFCDHETIRSRVKEILAKYGEDSGHIFNLGHGINKEVNPENLKVMIKAVKEFSIRKN